MTIKQKPLTRRKSYKYFTTEVTENVDDFWKVAAEGEIDSALNEDTLDFPESSAINDSSLKFKKEFVINEPIENNVIASSEKNEFSFFSDVDIADNFINFENDDEENVINNFKNNNEILNDNSKEGVIKVEEIIKEKDTSKKLNRKVKKDKTLIDKFNSQNVLSEKTNKERRKSFYEPNDYIIKAYLPDKLKKQEKSSIKKNKKNELIAISDIKRYSFDKNTHIKLKRINKTEIAPINLEKDAKIKDQMCNRNMIITVLKGSIEIEFDNNTLLIRNGGMCFVKNDCVYSITGISAAGSVLSVVYVK